MANPRIDELRRRLEREPGSRLFAQLAEELRKDGELPEAIRVARSGLQVHPNYPSARMTLGRALFDTKDLAAARSEFETVLRGAPDNILASRMLAESLEGMGDLGAALLQFRAALRLAPGDRQIEGQIRLLEQRLGAGRVSAPAPPPAPPPRAAVVPAPAPAPASPAPAPPPPVRAAPPPPPPAPVRLAPTPPPVALHAPAPASPPPAPRTDATADFDDVFETAPSWQRPAAGVSGPILLEEDEAPTLPGGSAGAAARASAHAAPEAPAGLPAEAPKPPPVPAPVTMAFEVPSLDEPPAWKEVPPAPPALTSADTLAGAPAFFPPPPSPGPDTLAAAVLGQSPFAAPEGEEPAPAPAAPDLSSTTLAELYLSQGIPEKALEVYEQLLEKDPQNERARARLREIKAQAAAPPSEPPAPAVPAPPTPSPVPPIVPDPHAERRLALQRAIARLEGLLAAVRRA